MGGKGWPEPDVEPCALAVIDAELTALRREVLLGYAKEMWFLRGVRAGVGPARPRVLKGPIDRRADQRQVRLFDDT